MGLDKKKIPAFLRHNIKKTSLYLTRKIQNWYDILELNDTDTFYIKERKMALFITLSQNMNQAPDFFMQTSNRPVTQCEAPISICFPLTSMQIQYSIMWVQMRSHWNSSLSTLTTNHKKTNRLKQSMELTC